MLFNLFKINFPGQKKKWKKKKLKPQINMKKEIHKNNNITKKKMKILLFSYFFLFYCGFFFLFMWCSIFIDI